MQTILHSSSATNKKNMSITNGFAGVSNCYVFKSRLQEYAQKVGFPTPMYETVKTGPSHEPYFRSTVIVNNVKYDSLPGFSNRKAAEQSAAEVALLELLKSGNVDGSISHPVHETGLCKNLLQEYAQKMNYAIPSYACALAQGKKSAFICTVDIGGIQYIGAAAGSKREAEIKAARTALLAIQSSPTGAVAKPSGSGELTVLPCKKKEAESDTQKQKSEKPLKPRKTDFKKKHPRQKFSKKKFDTGNVNMENSSAHQVVNPVSLEANQDGHGGEHVEMEVNLHQEVSISEPNISENGVTVAMEFNLEADQDGYGDEHVVSEVNLHQQVSKMEPNFSLTRETVPMDFNPEANQDADGGEHMASKVNLHKQVSTMDPNFSQNGVTVPKDLNHETSQDGHGSEHLESETNLHQQIPIEEPNASHNEVKLTLEYNPNDQECLKNDIFSEAQTNTPLTLASEAIKTAGVAPIAHIVTPEIPVMSENIGSELSNQDEDARRLVEA